MRTPHTVEGAAVLVAIAMVSSSSLAAQTRCEAECTVDLETQVVLGADEAGPLLSTQTSVVRAPSGYYFAAPTYEPGVIAVYDEAGRFVRRLGGEGEGPGESREIQGLAALEGDTLVVADLGHRITLFGPSLEHIRTFRVDVPGTLGSLTRMPGGGFAVQVGGAASDPALVDPILIYSGAGDRLHAFSSPNEGQWRLHGDADGLWLAKRTEYEVHLVDVSGGPERSITRDLAWFQPRRPDLPIEARRGNLRGASRLDGHIAVLVLRMAVPDPDALAADPSDQEAWARAREEARARAESPIATMETFTFYIDLFDQATDEFLSSHIFPDDYVSDFLGNGDGEVIVKREAADGRVLIEVSRLTLRY